MTVQGAGGEIERVLDDVEAFIRGYVVVGPNELTAVVLWVAHTFAFASFDATPYLYVSSVEKESGKTRLFEVLELLAERAWYTGRITASVLMRRVDAEIPTLLLDESDTAFSQAGDYADALRGLLNSGYRRGGTAWVSVRSGGDWNPAGFQTFCPKAFAGIGHHLPDTVASRSIPIRMKRRRPDESVHSFRRREVQPRASAIKLALASVLEPYADALGKARPDIPETLGDRAADVWEPLLAISDLAGNTWASRARYAALALSGRRETPNDSENVALLADIRRIFEAADGSEANAVKREADDRWPSAELLHRLTSSPDSRWRATASGRPLDAVSLARLLAPFEIRPRPIRLDNGKTPRGYRRSDFDDPFERYLPPAHIPSGAPSRNMPCSPVPC